MCVCVCARAACFKAEFRVLPRASEAKEGGRESTNCGSPGARSEGRLRVHRRRARPVAGPGGARSAEAPWGLTPPAAPASPGRARAAAGGGESRGSPARSPAARRFPPRAIYSSAPSCCRELTSRAEPSQPGEPSRDGGFS